MKTRLTICGCEFEDSFICRACFNMPNSSAGCLVQYTDASVRCIFFRRASFECTDGPKPFPSGLMFSLLPPQQTVMGQWILCAVNELGQCLETSSSIYLEVYIWCLCDKMCGEGETHAVSSHGAWVKATEYRDARNFLMEWVIAHSLKS